MPGVVQARYEREMERLPMYKNREILRLRFEQGCTLRQTARSLGVSIGAVSGTTRRAKAAGVGWDEVGALSDAELDRRLHPKLTPSRVARAEPDAARLHVELSRPGVTLELLHLEYLSEHPDGFRYTAFCARYRRWRKRRAVWMRQVHRAGEKAFVDFSGKRPKVVDPESCGSRHHVDGQIAEAWTAGSA